jgi:hypothetical protein
VEILTHVQVTCSKDTFDLTRPEDRFRFLHALYNAFGQAIRASTLLKNSKRAVRHAKAEIEQHRYPSLTAHGSTKRKTADDDGSQDSWGSKRRTAHTTQNAFEKDV